MRINVIAIGGLYGNMFSAGLKTILMRLDGVPNIDFKTYEDYNSWRQLADTMRAWRDPTVLLCHSFGVTAAFNLVRRLDAYGPEIPLVVAFDPSQWWWLNPWLTLTSGNRVPSKVKEAVCYYQSIGLIGRQTLLRDDGSTRGIANIHVSGTIHSRIEDRPDLQAETVKRIKQLAAA